MSDNKDIRKFSDDGKLGYFCKKTITSYLYNVKNWSMSNNYKISQKDLKAFVGDCFLYLKDKNLTEIKVSYHYIVPKMTIFY